MKALVRFALAWVTIALAACASAGPPPDSSAARDAIRRTDEDFSRYAQDHGIAEAFATYAAPDATMLPGGSDPVKGPDAIRTFFASSAGTVLLWKPYAAEVSSSGDLGYTLGTYESRSKDADGKPVTRYGKYCTIWEKQPDGKWKYVVDLGNPSPPPAGKSQN
jgi:ketosteroid isomerase-like protein